MKTYLKGDEEKKKTNEEDDPDKNGYQGLDLENNAYSEFWKDGIGGRRPVRAS